MEPEQTGGKIYKIFKKFCKIFMQSNRFVFRTKGGLLGLFVTGRFCSIHNNNNAASAI